MKNKKVIIIIICLLVILSVIGFILWNNRTISTINLDINPSITININKHNEVKSIIALNEEAKKVINNNMNGKPMNDVLIDLSESIIDNGYTDRGNANILLYTTGNINKDDIVKLLKDTFDERHFNAEIIVIENITKEDIELSKKYNISSSKAAFVNSISKEKEVSIDNIVNESIGELSQTKETGYYCLDGYILDGDNCVKEVRREKAIKGIVCPVEYYEYKGKCYKEVGSLESDKLICDNNYKLEEDNMCHHSDILDSIKEYECEVGELITDPVGLKRGVKTPVCVDKSKAKAPTLRCLLQPHKIINGKCYVGPAPVINGGCPNNDKLVGKGCYSKDPEDQWQCPNGDIYEKSKGSYVELCPDTFKYSTPTIKSYSCNEGYVLKDTKCIKEDIIKPFHERYCPDGYNEVDGGRCIDMNDIKEKQDGYKCEEDSSRLDNDTCIIFEYMDVQN